MASFEKDTGAMDTGAMDTGAMDTGAMDTGHEKDTGAMDTGHMDMWHEKDTGATMDYGAAFPAESQDICDKNACLPFQYGKNGTEIPCKKYKPANCFTEAGYEDFYNGINWDILKTNADVYFYGFGKYCWEQFSDNPEYMARFSRVYASYDFTKSIGAFGMFSQINSLVNKDTDYCGDINYSFAIRTSPLSSKNTAHLRIFHIALHSPKPKLVQIGQRRGDPANCAYFPKPAEDGAMKEAGSGPFHYKIDSLCSPPTNSGSGEKCKFLLLKEDKAPFKEFNYNHEFTTNNDDFQNITTAASMLDDALSQHECKLCKISPTRETLPNILALHNLIYNMFVEYFNTAILPGIRRDGAGLGAMDDSAGGKSIRRKSRRNRKSRKTKKSRKPRRLRKTTRLRK